MKNIPIYVVTAPEGKVHIRTARRGPKEGGPGFTIVEGTMNWKAAREISKIYAAENESGPIEDFDPIDIDPFPHPAEYYKEQQS